MMNYQVDEHFGKELTVYDDKIDDLKEKLWRAERALELLDVIMPEKVELAKKIAAGFNYDNTLGGHCQQLADGIDKIRA